MIMQELNQIADNLEDGYILGEELGEVYRQLFCKGEIEAPA
jgi:hypothetical protein